MSSGLWFDFHFRCHISCGACLLTATKTSLKREACLSSDFAGVFSARSGWSYCYSWPGMASGCLSAFDCSVFSDGDGPDLWLIFHQSSD